MAIGEGGECVSDIDFQNGFIVGMATRGLTVQKTSGQPMPFHAGIISRIYSISTTGTVAHLSAIVHNVTEHPYVPPVIQVVNETLFDISAIAGISSFQAFPVIGMTGDITVLAGELTI